MTEVAKNLYQLLLIGDDSFDGQFCQVFFNFV
jgi:hypothetical protein